MNERILTEHQGQKLSIKWDDTRFAITEEWDNRHGYGGKWPILLSPREMHDVAEFERKYNTKYIAGLKEKYSIIGYVDK